MPLHTLFVYGTLKKQEMNYPVLQRLKAEFVGEGSIEGFFLYTLPHGIPFIFPSVYGGTVYGEMYVVEEAVMSRLDAFEGGYRREKITAHSDDGDDEIPVEVYVWDREIPQGCKTVGSGKFEGPRWDSSGKRVS